MHVYCVIGETRNFEVEVWEELDFRNFYISLATAVPTRLREPKEENTSDLSEAKFFLTPIWMMGWWCAAPLGIFTAVWLMRLELKLPVLGLLFASLYLVLGVSLMYLAVLQHRRLNVK